jgi:hypothetical protein
VTAQAPLTALKMVTASEPAAAASEKTTFAIRLSYQAPRAALKGPQGGLVSIMSSIFGEKVSERTEDQSKRPDEASQ